MNFIIPDAAVSILGRGGAGLTDLGLFQIKFQNILVQHVLNSDPKSHEFVLFGANRTNFGPKSDIHEVGHRGVGLVIIISYILLYNHC